MREGLRGLAVFLALILLALVAATVAHAGCCSPPGFACDATNPTADCHTPVPVTTPPCDTGYTYCPDAACLPVPAGSVASSNWSSDMLALYFVEESSGTRVNSGGGSSLDLTASGGVGNDTTNKMQGSASIAITGDGLYVQTTASALTSSMTPPFTYCAWYRLTDASNSREMIGGFTSSVGGYTLWTTGAPTSRARLYTPPSQYTDKDIYASLPTSEWHHGCATLNAANTALNTYSDGAIVGTALTGTTLFTAPSTWRIGGGQGDNYWRGQIDEVMVDTTEFSASAICKVARCGVDGKLCECDGTTPANYKSCSTNSDCRTRADTGQICDTGSGTCRGRFTSPTISCTPAACNASAP
jgi:hypothetical protein